MDSHKTLGVFMYQINSRKYKSLLFSSMMLLPAVAYASSPDTVKANAPARGVAAYGVSWLDPSRYSDSESQMTICTPPKSAVKKKAPAARATPRRVPAKPTYVATPAVKSNATAAPRPRRRAAKAPAKPVEEPMMLCSQINLGPTMMGGIETDESIIPLSQDIVRPDVAPVPLVDARIIPLQAITPVTTPVNRGGVPLGWLVGGGGVGVFTWFSNGGGGEKGDDPRTPRIPEIPVGPPITTTPEPATLALLGTGIAAIAGAARRRKR